MSEVIFVLLLAGGMIGSGVYVGLKSRKWYFLYVFLTFFACFGLWEWASVAQTGESISQTIWKLGETNPFGFWVMLISLVIAWLSLMYHFATKKIHGRKKQRSEYDGSDD